MRRARSSSKCQMPSNFAFSVRRSTIYPAKNAPINCSSYPVPPHNVSHPHHRDQPTRQHTQRQWLSDCFPRVRGGCVRRSRHGNHVFGMRIPDAADAVLVHLHPAQSPLRPNRLTIRALASPRLLPPSPRYGKHTTPPIRSQSPSAAFGRAPRHFGRQAVAPDSSAEAGYPAAKARSWSRTRG
jgi:hypothetical protein